LASFRKNELKTGTSYRILVKIKNARTNTLETRGMTWKVPNGFTEEEIQQELNKIAEKFENELKCKQLGLTMNDSNMRLLPFIDIWLERIKRNKSKNYYKQGVKSSSMIKEYFGDIKFSEITPVNVQGFVDSLFKHKIVRHSSILTGDLKSILLNRVLTLEKVKDLAGVKRGTVERMLGGYAVRYENALKICKGLKLSYNQYFKDVYTEKNYEKETIKKHKLILSAILANAKKMGYVEDNYASPEYLEPIRGFKEEVKILNEQEAKTLLKELEKEPEPRRKIALMIVLLMGIRRAELAGLEWKDIDFENKTMTISRSSFRDDGGVTYTKDPKTETSKRIITMPDKLVKHLLEYKQWWDNRKSILKSVWKNSDRLLLSDDGRIICPTMYVKWLHVILDRAGLPRVTLHSLRHTNITLQLIAGIDIKTVAVRAGHARASTTSDFYSHFLKNSDKNASSKINDIFNRQGGLYSGDNYQE